MSVVIETTIGDLTVDLFTEERPIACLNFIKLCKLKYYNFNLFHTIEQGFIAQSGDPTGAGDGGSSIWGVVEDQRKRFFEAERLPKIHHTSAGLLSLVGAGKLLVGSQFFITLGENLSSLDGQHCVIGEVVEGHDVLRKLNEAIVDENFRPYQDIRITHTVILDDPFPDPRGFREPSRSPSPNAERLQNGRIAADEDIDDTEGKSLEEIQEMLAEREAKARATILEIVGDLPDAEMAPPENVLFVCKLNPVTTDDDLEIIFSRFGKVKGCEVIRDRKTGDSLQYAFVEFEEQKSCEAAYFKMDNVLIDDRRIHVDFSQSVSKVKWKGKGRGVEGNTKDLDFNNLRNRDEKYRNSQVGIRTGRSIRPTASQRGTGNYFEKSPHSTSREKRSSIERTRSRNDRHKVEQKQYRMTRSRSRSRRGSSDREVNRNKNTHRKRSRSPYYSRKENNRLQQKHYGKNRSRSKSRQDSNDSEVKRNNRHRRRSRSPYSSRKEGNRLQSREDRLVDRKGNYSPERKVSRRHADEKHLKSRSPERNSKRSDQLKRCEKSDTKRPKKSKRSKHKVSSSEESSSDSETTESSDSSSSSGSSIEKRKRKKSKKNKHKSKKTKSKKHKK